LSAFSGFRVPSPSRREIAGDAVHAQAVGSVGRHLDLDRRIVEAQRLVCRRPGLGLGRQVDDAAMVVAQASSSREEQSMPLLSSPRILLALSSRPVPGMVLPDGAKMPFMPVRALGAPHTTCTTPLPVVDLADAQPVGIGMLHRFDDVADDETLQRLGRIGDASSTSRPEHGQRVADFSQRRVVSRCLLQPGQRELHRPSPPVSDGHSSVEKP